MIDLNALYLIFDRRISVHRFNGHVLITTENISEKEIDKLETHNMRIVNIQSTAQTNQFTIEVSDED